MGQCVKVPAGETENPRVQCLGPTWWEESTASWELSSATCLMLRNMTEQHFTIPLDGSITVIYSAMGVHLDCFQFGALKH